MITDFRLKIFEAVASCKSFTKAAKALGISQPAVSQNIAELEQQIGDTLVIRGRSQLQLTEKGELLLDYAGKILHLYQCLNQELIPTASPATAFLRIAACPVAAKFLLPDIIEKYKAIYSGVEVALMERENYEMGHLLSQGMVDIAVSDKKIAGFAFEPFIDFTLSGGQKNLKELCFFYDANSALKETIKDFILTSKTCL